MTPQVQRRRAADWLVLLGCLIVVAVIAVLAPDPATDVRRDYDDVAVGEWGSMPALRLRADQVRLTRAVDDGYRSVTSAVTFVLVDVSGEVSREQVRFSSISLHTADGHDYEPRSEFISEGPSLTPPGFTRRGTWVFEVPDDRVAGARLLVEPDGSAFDVYSAAIRVDLGLSRSDRPAAAAITVAPATLEVTR